MYRQLQCSCLLIFCKEYVHVLALLQTLKEMFLLKVTMFSHKSISLDSGTIWLVPLVVVTYMWNYETVTVTRQTKCAKPITVTPGAIYITIYHNDHYRKPPTVQVNKIAF